MPWTEHAHDAATGRDVARSVGDRRAMKEDLIPAISAQRSHATLGIKSKDRALQRLSGPGHTIPRGSERAKSWFRIVVSTGVQCTILDRGISRMPVAPALASAGIKVLISFLGTTDSTAYPPPPASSDSVGV